MLWKYDGHGINDESGRRLLKAQIPRMDVETQGVRREFDRVSILAASSPRLLAALKGLLECCPALMIDQSPEALREAYAAIAEAEREDV